jgi:hypothetical protein
LENKTLTNLEEIKPNKPVDTIHYTNDK